MKDIDFDELDRAVSSALGVDVSNSANPAASEVKTPTVGGAVSTPAATATAPKEKSLVQRRASGRFMDIVRPASDARVQSKAPVSRHGATIAAPSATSSASSQAVVTPVEAEKSPAETVKAEAKESRDYPDPLDFHNFSDTLDGTTSSQIDTSKDHTAPVAASSNPFATTPSDALSTPSTPESEAKSALDLAASELHELHGLMQDDRDMPPLDTPFVQDLAVEKRPLGAFSVDDTDSTLLTDEAKLFMNAKGDDTAQDTDDTAPKAPEASESAAPAPQPEPVEKVAEEAKTDDNEAIEAQSTPEPEIVPEELRQDIVAVEAREVTHGSTPSATGLDTGSIPRQYKEAPATSAKEAAPVFDAENYHQPLQHPKKKKSGLISVIVISLLVIAGIGAGAAVYLLDVFSLFS